jgi:hypothetical protein
LEDIHGYRVCTFWSKYTIPALDPNPRNDHSSQEMYGIGMTGSASPAAAVVSLDSIPFATPDEMFVIKLCASARRLSEKKMWQDVADAEFVAESVHWLHLAGDPIEKAHKCLAEFLPKSQYPEEWWYQKLGMFNKTCTFADWFALGSSS